MKAWVRLSSPRKFAHRMTKPARIAGFALLPRVPKWNLCLREDSGLDNLLVCQVGSRSPSRFAERFPCGSARKAVQTGSAGPTSARARRPKTWSGPWAKPYYCFGHASSPSPTRILRTSSLPSGEWYAPCSESAAPTDIGPCRQRGLETVARASGRLRRLPPGRIKTGAPERLSILGRAVDSSLRLCSE